jgi:predicted transposase YbfD/YdcC
MENFLACFGDVVDPRRDNARHDLHELLVIALCAMLCGGEDCTDMALFGQAKEDFLRRFLRLRHGIPSHDTFSRLFRDLDPASFHAAFQSFMAQFSAGLSEVIAIDGKTLRRSFDHASAKSPLHLVSAWASEQRLVLGQIAVDGKSNEITAVPKLLELLTLKGRIVTLDAMHCQRATAAAISERGGDYALALKGNQGTLFGDVRLFVEDAETTPADTHTTTDGDHGRIETRRHSVITNIDWLKARHHWPGLAAIGKVVRTRESRAKTSTETTYYLISDAWDAQTFARIIRAHWSIENSLHWVLDVTMRQDAARNRLENGPENIALLRKWALNIAKTENSKGSMKGKLKRAGWDNTFLEALLANFKTI